MTYNYFELRTRKAIAAAYGITSRVLSKRLETLSKERKIKHRRIFPPNDVRAIIEVLNNYYGKDIKMIFIPKKI
jgi:hypothetical protein